MKIKSIPQIYRNVNRWGEILTVLSKHGLADWLSRFEFEITSGWLKARDGAALAKQTRETRIRLALMELGPTFIKLGQLLSTRPDLVGVALANELEQLQQHVEPDKPEVVRRLIEEELGQPVEDIFAEFDDQPIASASIGQVHRARLPSGEAVAVKVQHADIVGKVRVDLDILAGMAQLAERVPEFTGYRPRATVAEFQRMLRRELDFGREERNMQQFARDFADNPAVHIPEVHTELSTPRVLTMEFVRGIKLADRAALATAGLDLKEIARRGAEIYMDMIFTHGFYHADPHPGNILLLQGNVIGLLDFGMVGRIDDALQEDIEDMLMAIVNQDSSTLTSIIMRIGEVPADLDEISLSLDVTEFVSHYGNQSIADLQLTSALNEMTEIMRRYHIMLPARIAMLLKTLIMLEGTARAINPTFSLMEIMRPYQRKMMFRRFSPGRQFKKVHRIYSEFERLVEVLPRRLADILTQVQSGKFDVHLDHRGLEPSVNRLVLGMLTSALFLGSSIMLSQKVWPAPYGISVLGAFGAAVSLLLGFRLLIAINKSGHLDRRE